MDVIRHQDVSVDFEPMRSRGLAKQFEVVEEVSCGRKVAMRLFPRWITWSG